MYIPASFRESDPDVLRAFIGRYSFATLISRHDDAPFASHFPLLHESSPSPDGKLIGHMARANPQWKTADGQQVLAIFHGPHAYVSPSWYREQNVVPTWNYAVVHVYGRLSVIQDRQRLIDIVRRTVEIYESPRPEPWSADSPEPEFANRLLDSIVGFEIEIDRTEGKWKLSQNHSLARQLGVVEGLHESGRPDELEVASLMKERLDRSPQSQGERPASAG